ncbi:MAG: glycosyltransferase [Selenomonadaceae bacterium]|nr:glycosyltransferase [Selenomonadaceae bacterium]
MKKTPYFSVIVPMYNVQRYIKLCIDSILNQTFKDFEIIIVDDASTDDSYKICNERYGDNEKVRIIRQEKNQGQGPARNNGIANALGKYIYFLDSDDLIMVDTLEKIHEVAEKTDADVIRAAGYFVTYQDDDKPIEVSKMKKIWDRYNTEGFLKEDKYYRLVEHYHNHGNFTTVWLCCYKREFLKRHSIKFEAIISEDELFTIEIYCYAEKYYVMHNSFYVYRRHSGTTMTNYNYNRIKRAFKAVLTMASKLERALPNVKQFAEDKIKRNIFIERLLSGTIETHIRPFYDKLNDELDSTVNAALLPTFGKSTGQAKYIFDILNSTYKKNYELKRENSRLEDQLKRLNRLIDLYMWENERLENMFNEMTRVKESMTRPFDNLCHESYEHFYNLSRVLLKKNYTDLMERVFRTTVEKIRRKDKIKVAFVTDNAAMWCGDELYNYFAEHERFEATVFLCLNQTELSFGNVQKDFRHGVEQFKSRGINVIGIDNLNTPIEKQDIIIFLRPYLNHYPRAFHLYSLTPDTLLVNIPYSFHVSDWTYVTGTSNTPFNVLWKYFFDTQEHMESYKKSCDIPVKSYYSGYPRLDSFFDKETKFNFEWKMARPDAVKIIYAPHWTIDDRGVKYSTFRYNYKFFYEYAKAHPETSWIIKPHPHLFAAAVTSGLFPSDKAFEEYLKAWDDLPNAKLVTGAYFLDIFATSDGMILDSGSFIGEYQYTHKPMIFLTRETQKFNDLSNELMKVVYRVDGKDLNGIEGLIQKIFIDGKDEMYDERRNFFDKYCNYVKDNGMTASEYIFKTISQELL